MFATIKALKNWIVLTYKFNRQLNYNYDVIAEAINDADNVGYGLLIDVREGTVVSAEPHRDIPQGQFKLLNENGVSVGKFYSFGTNS